MTIPTLPDEARLLVEEMREKAAQAEDRHEQFRRKAERHYAMYRSYRDFKRSYRDARGRRDVDEILRDGQRTFGTHLFIPYCFSVVETTLPRMLSNNPKLLILPAKPAWEDKVENVKVMIDAQQRRIDFPLTLQDIGKSGLIYGLGVGKSLWDEKWKRGKKVLERATVPTNDGANWIQGKQDVLIYEGPNAECVDVFDWLWDPYAHSADTLRYCFHRTWRDNQYIKDMVDREVWELPKGVELRDLIDQGSDNKRDELWTARMAAAGYTTPNKRGDHLHEVLEFHDGDRVITTLDRACPVQAGPNNAWHGEIPFYTYRPTRVLHEMVGIGEIEAIEDLQEEMNELRSQRRDNAQLALQRPFAYFDGLVDPGDIAFGPGIGIPVDGDPREVIFPLPLQDIPQSGYQEEARLQSDIERVTGIDDTVSGADGGGGGASSTATGVQLVQAAANVRIQNKTKRIELEVAKPVAEHFLELDQQKIVESQQVIGPPKPGEPDREWSWYEVGPEELAGQFLFDVEGGSTQPKNPVKDADDAQRMGVMFGQNQLINPQKLAEYQLKKMGVDNPGGWFVPQEPQVPMHILEMVSEAMAQELGADPDQFRAQFEELVQGAMLQEQDRQEAQGAPGGEQQQPVAA